jgi:hypothetical protein
VGAPEIATGAVGADELATSSVGADELGPGSITAADAAADMATQAELTAAEGALQTQLTSISQGGVADGTVTFDKLAQDDLSLLVVADSARSQGGILRNVGRTGFAAHGVLTGITPTTAGTVAAPSATEQGVKLTTGAVIGNTAFVHGGFVGTAGRWLPAFMARVMLDGFASAEAAVGLFASDPLGAVCPVGSAGFRYSLATLSWHFVYNTGSGEVAVDTSFGASTNHMQQLAFWVTGAQSAMTWRIRSFLPATGARVAQVTGTVAPATGPTAPTTVVGPFAGVRTTVASAKNMQVDSLGFIDGIGTRRAG